LVKKNASMSPDRSRRALRPVAHGLGGHERAGVQQHGGLLLIARTTRGSPWQMLTHIN
jgi:hypothetical protein